MKTLFLALTILFSIPSFAGEECAQTHTSEGLTFVSEKLAQEMTSAPLAGKDDNWYYSAHVRVLESTDRRNGNWSALIVRTQTATRVCHAIGCTPEVRKSCFKREYRFSVESVNGCLVASVNAIGELAPAKCLP